MSDVSAILSLPYILPAQAQKHVTHNEALRQLDLAVQLCVTARDLTMPPASPAEGDRYIVAAAATAGWAGQDGAIALFAGGEGWLFTSPLPGWRAYVTDEAALVVFDGTNWQATGGGAAQTENLSGVGINTTSDTTNRLAVTAPATLLNHEGQGHQVKINKSTATDTASLLFQTNWSGRAEMGTTGSDAFEIKVSADGAAWATALSADPATGALSAPQGLQVDGLLSGTAVQQGDLDDTAGRLLCVGAFGLGGQMPNCPGDDVDQAPAGSYCKFDVADVNKPGPINSAGMVRTMRWSGNALLQIAHLTFPGSHENRVYRRVMSGGTWQAWQESFSQNNALGTVSLSGGAPTGALIEQGSTAQGRYVRFADGTQICTYDAPAQSATDTLGALFRSTAASWTYPAGFASAPVLTGHVTGGESWVSAVTVTNVDADFARISAISDATARPVALVATGHWA